MYMLCNCKLIPALTEGTALTMADLVVDGEVIREILPCGARDGAGMQTFDLGGKTVMPGLIDAHIHLRSVHPLGSPRYADPNRPCAVVLDELLFAQFFLDNGYTTVRVPGDLVTYPLMDLRSHIEAGKFQGPRILTSGPILSPTQVGNDGFWAPMVLEVDGTQQMRATVRKLFQKGVDFIKLYGTGSLAVAGAQPNSIMMNPDEIREAVMIADQQQSYCAIHCHGAYACDVSAKLGVRTIEHASFIQEDTIKYLEDHKEEGQGVVLTTSIFVDEPLGLVHRTDAKERCFDCLRKFTDHDALVGWGTDTDLEFYQQDPYAEFRVRTEELGFSNEEILQQATINTAKLIMQDDRIGSVKAGKLADLIVIDGDPAADLSAMYQRPVHVIKGGRFIR